MFTWETQKELGWAEKTCHSLLLLGSEVVGTEPKRSVMEEEL